MSASQLLRILHTLPAGADDQQCANDEPEDNMNKSSRCTNPFLSNVENNEGNIWNNPELECSFFGNEFTNKHEDEKFRKSLKAVCNGFYIDKRAAEWDVPELMVCYKERDFHVKNICIDEGMCDAEEETISINENDCKYLCNSMALNGDDDMIEANLDDIESLNNYADDVDQQPFQGSMKELPQMGIVRSKGEEPDQNGQTIDMLTQSKIEQSFSFNFDTREPATGSKPSKHQDVANHMQYGQGEASFSMAGVISEIITCARPITFSGNISTRSDSRATSTRSFTFPTLHTEGNNSPVRMGKVERRRLRNYRGWTQGLLCCRF